MHTLTTSSFVLLVKEKTEFMRPTEVALLKKPLGGDPLSMRLQLLSAIWELFV